MGGGSETKANSCVDFIQRQVCQKAAEHVHHGAAHTTTFIYPDELRLTNMSDAVCVESSEGGAIITLNN